MINLNTLYMTNYFIKIQNYNVKTNFILTFKFLKQYIINYQKMFIYKFNKNKIFIQKNKIKYKN